MIARRIQVVGMDSTSGPELVMVGRKEWEWGRDGVGWVIYMFCGVTKFRFGRVSVHSRAKSN